MASRSLQHISTTIYQSCWFTWEDAASAYLLVQNPCFLWTPCCLPPMSNYIAFQKSYCQTERMFEDCTVRPSWLKRVILLHLLRCSHHDIIVCFSQSSPVGLLYNKAVIRNNAMLRTSQQPQSSNLFLRLPPPPNAAAGHPPVQLVFNGTVSQDIQHPLHAIW